MSMNERDPRPADPADATEQEIEEPTGTPEAAPTSERERQQEAWRRAHQAFADAAELRAFDAAAFALHLNVPDCVDGPYRILWVGWLEGWAEFYLTHAEALERTDTPLSAEQRKRLAEFREVLDAFGGLFEIVQELDRSEGGPFTWREGLSMLARVAPFLHRWASAFSSIRATRSQLLASYPTFERIRVAANPTAH